MAVERAELLFGNLDTNSDGDITEEEFVKNCLKDKDLCDALATKQGHTNSRIYATPCKYQSDSPPNSVGQHPHQ